MLTALMLTTLTLAAAPVPAHAFDQAQQGTPIKVWLNKKNDVKVGDRVKVYARAESDGYLLVLHAEPDGRIRVLFPLDPTDDNFIRGGQDYELRGRGDREAFRVFATSGLGTVYAAFSRDPFRFGDFVRADHWDYRILDQWKLTEDLDPEAELTALAQAMAGGVGFQYDITYYGVGENVAYYGGGGNTYVSMGYGWGYYPGFSVSFGWGWPSAYWGWYDPWYYGYYSPYYYYPYYGYYPYYAHYPYYPYYPYYAYYPYYPNYGGGYYPGYGGRWPTYPSGSQYRGKYTFKDADRYNLARGGIGERRPSSMSGPALRSDLGGRYAADLSGRRAAPGTQRSIGGVATDAFEGRRVSPTADRATGRAVAPSTAATAGRRTVAPTGTDAARTQPASGRQVQPSGWGITDGRRVVPATPRQPEPATSGAVAPTRRTTPTETGAPEGNPRSQPAAGSATRRSTPGAGERSVTPQRSTVPDRAATPQRATSPDRSVTPQRSTAPSRSVTPQRSTAPSRSATPQRSPTPQRSTPSLERRTAPQRSATPQRTPTAAPRPSTTQRPPSTSRAPAAAPRSPAPRASSPPRTSSPPARSSSPPRSSGGSGRRPGGGGH